MPYGAKMSVIDLLLTSQDDQEVKKLWKENFLTIEFAARLVHMPAETVAAVLTKGLATPLLWTTTRAAVAIRELTGLCLVQTDGYADIFF